MHAHRLFPLVFDFSLRRAVVILGPRRVGKTVLMHHTVDALIESGFNARCILLLSLDNPVYMPFTLDELMQLGLAATGEPSADQCVVFYDEIQFSKDWERELKVLVDQYPETRFVASGSASASLLKKSSESGAGRFHDFVLPSLSFREYLQLSHAEHLVNDSSEWATTPDVMELNARFFDFLNFGGYPEVLTSDAVRQDPARFIRMDILDKVLLRDLPSLFGIRDIPELYRFFTFLAYNTGQEFAPQQLSKESGLTQETIRKYLQYFESAFLIRVLHKVDQTARRFQRITGFKVYLTNPSLRTALFAPVHPAYSEAGNLLETGLANVLPDAAHQRIHYASWRTGNKAGEVDFVWLDPMKFRALHALECKWSNRYVDKPGELKSLLAFCAANALNEAWVTTIDRRETRSMNGVTLEFVPAALLVLTFDRTSGHIEQAASPPRVTLEEAGAYARPNQPSNRCGISYSPSQFFSSSPAFGPNGPCRRPQDLPVSSVHSASKTARVWPPPEPLELHSKRPLPSLNASI